MSENELKNLISNEQTTGEQYNLLFNNLIICEPEIEEIQKEYNK